MRTLFWATIGSSFIVSFFPLYAAEKLNWENSVEEASRANAELLSAKNSLQSSQYLIGASRSGYLPIISASAGYNYDSSANPKYYSASINAKENLFSGFLDQSKNERAKLAASSSEASLESVKAKISFDLKSAFMGLIYSQKYIALTEDIIKRREANLKLVQLRFESGRENIGSFDLSKAYLAQARYDHLQATNSLEVFQADLARILGREDSDFEALGMVPVVDPSFENGRKINYKDLVKNIPDFKKAFLSEQSAKASIDLSRSAFFPSLDLFQNAGRTGREDNSPVNNWTVGASITFPLFNGGQDYYSMKSATEDYRASANNRKNTEDESVTKLKNAYSRYIEAVMKLQVDEAFVVAAKSRERIAKAQYNNGLITFSDWDIIENDLIARQKALLQTQRERVVAEATWEQVQGKGVIP